MQELKEEKDLNVRTRSRKEQAAVDLRDGWEKFKEWMEKEVLPYIDRSELIPREICAKFHDASSGISSGLYHLQAPYEPTPEEVAKREEAVKARENVDRRSDVQKCVDEWLKEQVEENDLNPALLEDDSEGEEEFTFTYRETRQEYCSGVVSFEVPQRLKDRLDEVLPDGFGSAMRDHLYEQVHDSFYVETDYDDGEIIDSSCDVD